MARKNLPDYGSRSIKEIRESIDSVWNRCKHLEYRPGEAIASLSIRIQAEVNQAISGLSFKLTFAHEDLLRVVGNETFCIVNFTYGDPVGANAIDKVKLDQNSSMTPRDYWDAFCRQPVLKGVCGNQAQFLVKLHNLVGIFADDITVVVRSNGRRPVKFGNPNNPDNHAIVKVSLQGDMSRYSANGKDFAHKWRALNQKFLGTLDRNRQTPEGDLYSKEYSKLFDHHPGAKEFRAAGQSEIFSDLTFANVKPQRPRFEDMTTYPRPQYSFVGAKGDDVFRVFFAALYYPDPPEWFEPSGRSVFGVRGFAKIRQIGTTPLDAKVVDLARRCTDWTAPLK